MRKMILAMAMAMAMAVTSCTAGSNPLDPLNSTNSSLSGSNQTVTVAGTNFQVPASIYVGVTNALFSTWGKSYTYPMSGWTYSCGETVTCDQSNVTFTEWIQSNTFRVSCPMNTVFYSNIDNTNFIVKITHAYQVQGTMEVPILFERYVNPYSNFMAVSIRGITPTTVSLWTGSAVTLSLAVKSFTNLANVSNNTVDAYTKQ